MNIVELGPLIEEGRWSGYRKLLIFGTALAVLLVGMDNQLLPNAINSMMNDWKLARGSFSNVLFVGPIGMLFGALLGGMLGDRIGRRSALLLSVVTFAVLTYAIAFADGIAILAVLRFLSALGFGAAMPNAVALAFEYVPKRNRAVAVTLTIICIPLGGFSAAFLSRSVLLLYRWHMLFKVGGIITIVLALILFKLLPESPLYLATRRERWPELIALLRKLGHTVSSDVIFAESGSTETRKSKASIRDLFAPAFRLNTVGLFGAFFFCLLANYIGIQMLPVMLTGSGFTTRSASGALGNWNLGGVAVALLGAYLIHQLGSRITMLGMSAISIGCAILLTTMTMDPKSMRLTIMFVLLGGCMNAAQTAMYVLAANVYPTAIRGTGIGAAVAIGRIGAVMAGQVGVFAMGRGTTSFFGSLAITMALTFVSLALVRRHIRAEKLMKPGF